jgi:hypothetical protein
VWESLSVGACGHHSSHCFSSRPRTAWAQAGSGNLTGTVRDSQGGALPGVTVTATNNATGAVRTTVTNETGAFNMPGSHPGPTPYARN